MAVGLSLLARLAPSSGSLEPVSRGTGSRDFLAGAEVSVLLSGLDHCQENYALAKFAGAAFSADTFACLSQCAMRDAAIAQWRECNRCSDERRQSLRRRFGLYLEVVVAEALHSWRCPKCNGTGFSGAVHTARSACNQCDATGHRHSRPNEVAMLLAERDIARTTVYRDQKILDNLRGVVARYENRVADIVQENFRKER